MMALTLVSDPVTLFVNKINKNSTNKDNHGNSHNQRNNIVNNHLEPCVSDDGSDPFLRDVRVVGQRVVDGHVTVNTDYAQRQHGHDDKAVVGPAHHQAPRPAQGPPATPHTRHFRFHPSGSGLALSD